MTRTLFLQRLREALQGMSPAEIGDILSDWEAYFDDAIAAGRSEEDIAASLGDPITLAKRLRLEQGLEGADIRSAEPLGGRNSRAIVAIIILAVVSCAVLAWFFGHNRPASDTRIVQSSGGTTLPMPAKPAAGTEEAASPVPTSPQPPKLSEGQKGLAHAKPPAAAVTGSQPITPPAASRPSVAPAPATTAPQPYSFSYAGRGAYQMGHVDKDAMTIDVTGSGSLSAEGRVGKLVVTITNKGSADLGKVSARQVFVVITGSGNATVSAEEDANIEIRGSGNVYLLTKPRTIERTIAGSGRIIEAN